MINDQCSRKRGEVTGLEAMVWVLEHGQNLMAILGSFLWKKKQQRINRRQSPKCRILAVINFVHRPR